MELARLLVTRGEKMIMFDVIINEYCGETCVTGLESSTVKVRKSPFVN